MVWWAPDAGFSSELFHVRGLESTATQVFPFCEVKRLKWITSKFPFHNTHRDNKAENYVISKKELILKDFFAWTINIKVQT
jgi:hypothetical protein